METTNTMSNRDSLDPKSVHDEASFLAYLRKFYDWQTSSHVYPEKVSELDAWKIILRLMDRGKPPV